LLKRLELKNWKSFQEATLHVDPLTILIGVNASGKSNLLDALVFLTRVASGSSIFSAIQGDVSLEALRGGAEWVCRKPFQQFTLISEFEGNHCDYRYELTVHVPETNTKADILEEKLTALTTTQRGKVTEKKLFYTQQQDTEGVGIPTLFYTPKRGPGKRKDLNRSHIILGQTEAINDLHEDVQEGAKTVLTALQKVFVFDPIPSHMRDYAPFADRLYPDGANLAGVLAGLTPTRKAEVEATLTRYFQKLPERDIHRVYTEPVGKFGKDAMLYCEEGWTEEGIPNTVDARGMSDGSLRFLAIVTAMLTRPEDSLLVIEEVDNGLHPSRAHVLLEMLATLGQQRRIDVLVTTHNPALLDAAGFSMVPFIGVVHRDPHQGASRLTQLEDIKALPKLIAGGSLGYLSATGALEQAAVKGELNVAH
jgi:predicted ATPase